MLVNVLMLRKRQPGNQVPVRPARGHSNEESATMGIWEKPACWTSCEMFGFEPPLTVDVGAIQPD
jgi:hypothetical protein